MLQISIRDLINSDLFIKILLLNFKIIVNIFITYFSLLLLHAKY